jgi:hypothetical protein
MRGFLTPAVRTVPSESQSSFAAMNRGRRSKVAKAANTTLVKADQWARGDVVPADVSEALEGALKARKAPKKK